ncbi:LysR family transcriptional regulator [Pigmentiphaga soli]|uniref:LysR family transcriptional regulator n=1 Tax=Pigmentiphaga soli TaxID=1007095 RepID=A0ABP8GEF3_9BURK
MAQLDWYIRNELKPKHLRLLVALDDLRNVGKVAVHLNVTQPAVSKALAEIEKGLDARLFERTPRGIVPTVYGESLVRHARAMLNQLNLASDELRGLLSGAAGRICVGVLANVIPALLPQSLALLKARAPGINVLLREGTMERLLPPLLMGELDLLVGRPVERHAASELGGRVLLQDPLVVIAGPRHPLAGHEKLRWRDLEHYTWVLPAADGVLRGPLERVFEQHGMPMPAHFVEALSVQFVTTYLQLTDAVATMTREVARHYCRLGQLCILPFELPQLVRPLGITWNRRRPMSPSTTLLIECLEEVAASGTPA